MLRGHVKSFALYSLATLMVASPVAATSPGDASRRAAAGGAAAQQSASAAQPRQATSGVQNALGLVPFGEKEPIRQVVGKQPTAPNVDPNRSFSLLPNLFGRGQSSSGNDTTSHNHTPRRPSDHQTSNQTVQSQGILSGIFGSRPSSTDRASQPTAPTPQAKVDWQGIPYHQAKSKSPAKGPTPIRDPQPNETRLAGPSRLTSPHTSAPLPAPEPRMNPAIPQPPALAAAPSSRRIEPSSRRIEPSSRRTAPASTAQRSTSTSRSTSSQIQREDNVALSVLSSSRRSGRRDVPTLDASEIAAAKNAPATREAIVPKVSRRQVVEESKIADSKTAVEASISSSDPAPKLAESNAKPTKPAEMEPTKPAPKPAKTPAADIAMNPQPKAQPKPQPKAQPQPKPQPAAVAALPKPAATADTNPTQTGSDAALAESATSAPKHTTAPEANAKPLPAPAAPEPTTVAETAPAANAPAEPAPTTVAATAPAPAPKSAAPMANVASSPTPPSVPLSPINPPEPSEPQFVAPELPAPAAPKLGPTGSLAGHRIGPPASSFQPRPQPRAPLNPASTPFGPASAPIGSGVATTAPVTNTPPAAPMAQPAATMPQPAAPIAPRTSPMPTAPIAVQPYVPPHPVSQNPYVSGHDPYAIPQLGAPVAQPPATSMGATSPIPTAPYASQPTMPVVPETHGRQPNRTHAIAPGGSHLGTPMASTPATQIPAVPTPAPMTSDRPIATQPAPTHSDGAFQPSPQPRPVTKPSTSRELAAGQTAVASELPGIRVVTHGPSSVIIRQTHEFEIRVENRGAIDAEGLMVRAVIPVWADIKGHNASRGSVERQGLEEGDRLVWTLDSLPAGTTEKLFVRLQAQRSGTHGLDVDWTLIPQKSIARIEVREPMLDLLIEGPEEVVYGESQTYKVRVLNPGDGVAPNVVFTLSPNSPTPQTQRIGNIPSGKEAQFEVELTAQDLGDLKIHGLASGDLGLKAQAEKTIRVSAAELEAVLAGPETKYQNTDAMYHLQISNNGQATCKNVVASLALPSGVRYQGGIDAAQQQGTKLTWTIQSLPPGASRDYEFSCTMVSPGKQTFDFNAAGSAAGKAAVALDTRVESIADLVMTLQDPAAPAPVGTEVVYEIVIKNRGSRQANGVRAIAQFSNGIEPRRIEGHSGQVLTGQVLLDPIDSIRPGEEVRIRVIAEAESEGHHRFRTEIRSGETVLVAEEATQFLSKQAQRVSRRSSSSNR
ncbi:Large cysteine-rich periplasmic protein OmcB, serovars L1/L3 precursor [Stieleria maiorica]|uniref:Large cysteine-rich periplasmic protein OmcB, serovars L1/L3 n=1 Tax=Stieleria maiorica TaxID=2795974 RepID=A0A5B9MPT2_9BACT|nr:DUF11 domain-containing protein [Stieleria maiorica]QEG02007.1 Large cysteine-rich periplasmic protein OmcB, serovars L1/L3 precursor [Stieleria maiorica]